MVPAISTKASLNTLGGASAAATDPAATPTTAGSVQDRSTPGITNPLSAVRPIRSQCGRDDDGH